MQPQNNTERHIPLCFLIHNVRTAWPTKISIPFLSSLANLLKDACNIFQKIVDNFEIAHKTCLFLLRGAEPP